MSQSDKILRTVIIFDSIGEEPIKFAVLSGDYTRFDKVYINAVCNTPQEQTVQDEFGSMVYDENGREIMKFYKVFPYKAMTPNTRVIVAGFLP